MLAVVRIRRVPRRAARFPKALVAAAGCAVRDRRLRPDAGGGARQVLVQQAAVRAVSAEGGSRCGEEGQEAAVLSLCARVQGPRARDHRNLEAGRALQSYRCQAEG